MSISDVYRKQERNFPSFLFHLYVKKWGCSLTADNGKEFSNYEELEEKLQVHVYFAVPYCSW